MELFEPATSLISLRIIGDQLESVACLNIDECVCARFATEKARRVRLTAIDVEQGNRLEVLGFEVPRSVWLPLVTDRTEANLCCSHTDQASGERWRMLPAVTEARFLTIFRDSWNIGCGQNKSIQCQNCHMRCCRVRK
jgi:hypothetical protein